MSSVGQHHAYGTQSGMDSVTKLREKMLSSAHLSIFVLFDVLGLFYWVHVFCINYKINVFDNKCVP
jgi:hypothetical protein